MRNRADEIVYLMRTHSGAGHRHIPAKLLTAYVRYEWQSNRWAMITEPGTQRILGWISWYRLDDNSLAQVKEHGLAGCFYQKILLIEGDNLYLSNVVVREGLPHEVFQSLVRMAKEANPTARSITAHLNNRVAPRWAQFNQ